MNKIENLDEQDASYKHPVLYNDKIRCFYDQNLRDMFSFCRKRIGTLVKIDAKKYTDKRRYAEKLGNIDK